MTEKALDITSQDTEGMYLSLCCWTTDVDKYEDNLGESDIPMIILPRTKEVLLYQMDGLLSKQELKTAMEMGLKASEKVREIQVAALKNKYETIEAETTGA